MSERAFAAESAPADTAASGLGRGGDDNGDDDSNPPLRTLSRPGSGSGGGTRVTPRPIYTTLTDVDISLSAAATPDSGRNSGLTNNNSKSEKSAAGRGAFGVRSDVLAGLALVVGVMMMM